MRYMLLGCWLCLGWLGAQGQKLFEGTIHYTIKVTGEQALEFSPYLPKGQLLYLKDSSARFHPEGGLQAMDVLYLGKAHTAYLLSAVDSAYYAMRRLDSLPSIKIKPGPAMVAGKRCTKYILTTYHGPRQVVQEVWVSPELTAGLMRVPADSSGRYFFQGLPGFPLKIITPGGRGVAVSLELTADAITPAPVDTALLQLPEGFMPRQLTPDMPLPNLKP